MKTGLRQSETCQSQNQLLHSNILAKKQKQVKISDIISRRFGDFMTPLPRVEMRLKLTMRVQEMHEQIRLSCQRDALPQTINTEFERANGFYPC